MLMTEDEYSEKPGWWVNELSSLGVEINDDEEQFKDSTALENLTDDVKQNLIHEYKRRYSK
jgi:hypothetical protein